LRWSTELIDLKHFVEMFIFGGKMKGSQAGIGTVLIGQAKDKAQAAEEIRQRNREIRLYNRRVAREGRAAEKRRSVFADIPLGRPNPTKTI
jgi:hypothetical protein